MISYANIKAAMSDAGLPVSAGNGWNNIDEGSYQKYVINVSVASAMPYVPKTQYEANYGLAYPGVMPDEIVEAVTNAAYSGALAGTPLTGAHPLSVTWTLTETGGTGTSFAWDFGDGNTATTTVPTAAHSYAAAGSFTAKVTPTVNGVVLAQITAAAPAVVS